MYEIISNPEHYRIGALKEGLGYKQVPFPDVERKRWAEEIGLFALKLDGLSDNTKQLQKLFIGEETIMVSPASLKTFKVQWFKVNDALDIALDLAKKIESGIVEK